MLKLTGELEYADAEAARAAYRAMLELRAGNAILEAAELNGSKIRFSFEDPSSSTDLGVLVTSMELGVDQALGTANSGEVLLYGPSGLLWNKRALGPQFWRNRWDQNQTGFHEGKPNALLVAHVARIETKPKARILVPLAGKAVDLSWLEARGHEVVGVEFVESAIEALFRERGLDHRKQRRDCGPHPAYRIDNLTMISADVFELKREDVGGFDAIYDRGALIALEPSSRTSYVDTCAALLHAHGAMLVVAIAHTRPTLLGPPWSIDEPTLRTLHRAFDVEKLETHDVAPTPRMQKAGLDSIQEAAYLVRAQTPS